MPGNPSLRETNPAAQNIDLLNIAALCPATSALGPGLRAALWVQGCTLSCPGCLAPEWQAFHPARLVKPADLVEGLLANPLVSGLTLSGGEPLLQAAPLAHLVRLARRQRDLDIICFTGFTMEQIFQKPPAAGVWDLLTEVDVLIDGPYVQTRDDNHGLRGSTNQRIHYLSPRLRGYDFESNPRAIELQIQKGEILMVGIPPRDMGSLDEIFNPLGQNKLLFNADMVRVDHHHPQGKKA